MIDIIIKNIKPSIYKSKPILQFLHNKRTYDVCNVKNIDDAMYLINKVLEEANYAHYYTRVIEQEDCYILDYGSHQCFFKLLKEGGTNG
ncbi:hypothetical protein MRS_126 [Staphylococcus phage MR003]|nr:hypothetical protein [Staphylococcus phage vB_SauM-V1SA20]BBI90243.1 hypothetical protein MRS_126 [Staphylococcus phage MR003]